VSLDDEPSLIEELASPEVTKFIAPPPTGPGAFARFVSWAVSQRQAGRSLYLSVIPVGYDRAVGVTSLHAYVPHGSHVAWNWGFAVGAAWWGTGLFQDTAALTLRFAFDTMGLPQVEAWSPLTNGRAHGALDKLGGEPELLRNVRAPDGRHGTFVKWTIRHVRRPGL